MGSLNQSSEHRGLFSRLPEDPAYWENLRNRIVDDGRPVLRTYWQERRKWWSGLARFSTALAFGASAASIAALLLMPAGDPATPQATTADTYGLAPDDPMAVTLVTGKTPPSLETLMALRTAERTNE
jgi:hypothetical protein